MKVNIPDNSLIKKDLENYLQNILKSKNSCVKENIEQGSLLMIIPIIDVQARKDLLKNHLTKS